MTSPRFPAEFVAVSDSGFPTQTADGQRLRVWLATGVLTAATVAAYHNSFAAPFVFDDVPAIVENPSIRHLWPLSEVLAPSLAGGVTVSGRPVVNLSLALNYAVSGPAVWSYHGVNLAIHLAAGLLLFGLVRRTLLTPPLRERFGAASLPLALAAAALWTLHPLQTESVTYVVQRAESLVGLFYLLTLYAFVRGCTTPSGSPKGAPAERPAPRWLALSAGACFLGMATKEVMVSAPLMVWLYDRTFLGGSFRAAWSARRRFYVVLACSWLLLAFLVLGTSGRGGTAGFGAAMSSWTYALTQCRAIVTYLGLCVWPHPLIFDYGLATVLDLTSVLPQALLLVALVVAAVVAAARRPAVGFLAVAFFALLAPSSSFVPVATQTMAEHRMYLPLAAVLVLLVLGTFVWLGRWSLWGWGGVAAALGFATVVRNADYRSEVAIWADTATKLPTNARAHNNLGQALFRAGRVPDSVRSYEEALRLQPRYPETHYNLGVSLAALGSLAAAIGHYEEALRFQPDYPAAHNNLGNALMKAGRVPEALRAYAEALRLDPHFAEAHSNLGNALLQSGRAAEAVPHFERALRERPDYPEADALQAYLEAIRLKPAYAEAYVNAGNALLQLERPTEAIAQYERAIALDPALTEAQFNLGSALLDREKWTEAIPRFEQVLRADPAAVEAHRAIAYALARTGRVSEAVTHYQAVLRVLPGDAMARAALDELRGQTPAAGKRN
ncbi:MAG: tetratricopeptide repeat protein [Verrucomicrobia bacterium]|nr:tetratricopeptide repeat protein [Verrucomicrobiota bacterium]